MGSHNSNIMFTQALIKIDRQNGPSIVQAVNVDRKKVIDILVHALPNGTPKNNVFKVSKVGKMIGIVFLEKFGDGFSGYLMGYPEENVHINPFSYYQFAKQMVQLSKLAPEVPLYEEKRKTNLFEISDVFYAITSLLLREKVIVVGNQDKAISYFETLFNLLPYGFFSWLKAEFPATSLLNDLHIVNVESIDLHQEELKKLFFSSSIIGLQDKKCFGFYSSSFTKKLAHFVHLQQKDLVESELKQFNKLLNIKPIDNPADFANEFSLHTRDAKLLKLIQLKNTMN